MESLQFLTCRLPPFPCVHFTHNLPHHLFDVAGVFVEAAKGQGQLKVQVPARHAAEVGGGDGPEEAVERHGHQGALRHRRRVPQQQGLHARALRLRAGETIHYCVVAFVRCI